VTAREEAPAMLTWQPVGWLVDRFSQAAAAATGGVQNLEMSVCCDLQFQLEHPRTVCVHNVSGVNP